MSNKGGDTSQSSGEGYDAEKYWTSRDFKTSARLHVQHWLWNYQLGYILHPSIPKDGPGLRIADVAAGNGAWLIEAAREVPSSAKLEGFDISGANFPAQEWLPANVSMHVQDAFAELPEQLVGVYDVVHIRTIVSAVPKGDPGPLLKNLVQMLKPRGYLQWDENDPSTTQAGAPSPSVSAKASTELVHLLNAFGARQGMNNDWVRKLPALFESHNLNVVAYTPHTARKELMKAWTDNLLTVYEELAGMFPEASKAPPEAGAYTKEWYQGLFRRIVGETQQGVNLSMNGLVIVGQKRG